MNVKPGGTYSDHCAVHMVTTVQFTMLGVRVSSQFFLGVGGVQSQVTHVYQNFSFHSAYHQSPSSLADEIILYRSSFFV